MSRLPLVWPKCPKTIRHSRLTADFMKHAHGCSPCETFHIRRIEHERWQAAWEGKSFYEGAVCKKLDEDGNVCGKRDRRPYDGACYHCMLRLRPFTRDNLKAGINADGSSRKGVNQHRREQSEAQAADVLRAEASASFGGVTAYGWQYGDGRIHVKFSKEYTVPGSFNLRTSYGESEQFQSDPASRTIIDFHGGNDGALMAVLKQLNEKAYTK